MSKKTIAIFFVIGLVVAIIGSVLLGIGAAGAVNAANAGGTITASTFGPTYFLGAGLAGIGGLISLVAWVGALVATARLSRWGWFVVVLLLSGLGTLIYLIAGPSVSTLVPERVTY